MRIDTRHLILLPPLVVALAALVAVGYVSQETPTWFWDYAGYHDQLRHLSSLLRQEQILPFVTTIWSSIRESDYNVSSILPLLPAALLFSDERSVYILSLVLLYLLPASGLTWMLCRECTRSPLHPGFPSLAWLLIFCFPGFWGPTLRGYPDIAGLLPLAAAGVAILGSHYLTHAPRRQVMAVGLLLWLTFLIRRHYAYTIVAVVATTVGFGAVQRWRFGDSPGRALWRTCGNLLLLMAPGAVLVLLLQPELAHRILTSSYASLYSAYQEDWPKKIGDLLSGLGLINLALLLLGLLTAWKERNHRIGYCLVVATLTVFLFGQTQALNMHHRMAFYLWLFPVIVTPCFRPAAFPVLLPIRRMAASLLTALTPLVLLITLSTPERVGSLRDHATDLLSAGEFPPLQNPRYQELRSLVRFLEDDPRFAGKSIAILPSSIVLNESIVAAMSADVAARMVRVAHVDLRDGFPLSVLRAEVILASSRDSIHLGAEDQRVVTLPSKALFDRSSPFAAVYTLEREPAYQLEEGNELRIFRRKDPAPLNFTQLSRWMLSQFLAYYPDARIVDGRILLDGRPPG